MPEPVTKGAFEAEFSQYDKLTLELLWEVAQNVAVVLGRDKVTMVEIKTAMRIFGDYISEARDNRSRQRVFGPQNFFIETSHLQKKSFKQYHPGIYSVETSPINRYTESILQSSKEVKQACIIAMAIQTALHRAGRADQDCLVTRTSLEAAVYWLMKSTSFNRVEAGRKTQALLSIA